MLHLPLKIYQSLIDWALYKLNNRPCKINYICVYAYIFKAVREINE
jgi:hypothetical protein